MLIKSTTSFTSLAVAHHPPLAVLSLTSANQRSSLMLRYMQYICPHLHAYGMWAKRTILQSTVWMLVATLVNEPGRVMGIFKNPEKPHTHSIFKLVAAPLLLGASKSCQAMNIVIHRECHTQNKDMK